MHTQSWAPKFIGKIKTCCKIGQILLPPAMANVWSAGLGAQLFLRALFIHLNRWDSIEIGGVWDGTDASALALWSLSEQLRSSPCCGLGRKKGWGYFNLIYWPPFALRSLGGLQPFKIQHKMIFKTLPLRKTQSQKIGCVLCFVMTFFVTQFLAEQKYRAWSRVGKGPEESSEGRYRGLKLHIWLLGVRLPIPSAGRGTNSFLVQDSFQGPICEYFSACKCTGSFCEQLH